MEQNVKSLDAIARLIIGSLLVIYLVVGGPWWAIGGLYFLFSGAFRFCFFYFYFSDRQI